MFSTRSITRTSAPRTQRWATRLPGRCFPRRWISGACSSVCGCTSDAAAKHIEPGIERGSMRLWPVAAVLGALFLATAGSLAAENPEIGNHRAIYDSKGLLLPWTPWTDALDREMSWYLRCPVENGYPRFVYITFMNGDYNPIARRTDFIPSMQNGMGIISYLKYYAWSGKKNPKIIEFARYMGDYLVKESLTPDTGKYPRFTRSTGIREKFPQPADSGTQGDRPYEIEPDKGGIAGYALVLLYEQTSDKKYLDQALQNARVLAANKIGRASCRERV